MDWAACDRTTLVDLRGVQPAAERLLEIVRRCADLPAATVTIDWGEHFPWSLDGATTTRTALSETLVAAVGSEVAGTGKQLGIRLREPIPSGYSSRPGYRHLMRARTQPYSQWQAALGKLVADLLDDAMALLPSLAEVEFVGGDDRAAAALRAASLELGLRFEHTAGSPGASATCPLERHSGVEERLVRDGHPARTDRPISRAHASVRAWRDDGWRGVAALHEELVLACDEPNRRGDGLVVAMKQMGSHLRGAGAVADELHAAYAGLAAEGAVDRLLTEVCAPLREQYGQLSARVATLRRLR